MTQTPSPLKDVNLSSVGKSPLSNNPSPENILMAAADMHANGRFAEPQSSTTGMPRIKKPSKRHG